MKQKKHHHHLFQSLSIQNERGIRNGCQAIEVLSTEYTCKHWTLRISYSAGSRNVKQGA